jgi:penicillin-binding protein 1A
MWMVRLLAWAAGLFVILAVAGLGVAYYGIWYYSQDLPDYKALAEYQPPVTSRVHAGNGELIAEFARERRLFVPVDAIPDRVKDAFLAAEDKNFYSHPGLDFQGLARAILQSAYNVLNHRRPEGGSTITQQVAKNMLLTNEVSIKRKIREAILAFRLESALSKDRILELYLNEIYLGQSAYGVAAAALNYFDKSLDQLTVAEAAFLAALPKGPENYRPDRYNERAKARRDWVIDRMVENGFVPAAEGDAAKQTALVARPRSEVQTRLGWYSEEVRRQLVQRFGEAALYEGGLSVRTSLDPRLQAAAEKALKDGLMAYDRRHGWRGPLGRINGPLAADWTAQLTAFQLPPALLDSWRGAVVLATSANAAEVGFVNGTKGTIPMEELRWARPTLEDQAVGPVPKTPADVLKVGDVVAVEALSDKPGETRYGLRQIPDVGGAIVALDPHTGRVLALVGGWDFRTSQFNRATQAERQPGSSFKPFVYAAALDSGFTPSSLVLDGPFVYDQGPGLPLWKPKNYGGDFLGPTTLRQGLEKSRNLMTVRLAQAIGMDKVYDYATRLGAVDRMGKNLAMSLGAGETTVLRITSAYAKFVNGGKGIEPSLIDRVQDRNGRTVYRHDARACENCNGAWGATREPTIPDDRPQLLDPATAFQITWMLQGVVERGTAASLKSIGKPLGGKTGTSNDSFDNWFIGFSPDFVAGVFVGFDNPRTLGAKDTGGSSAVPIFKEFITEALKNKPAVPFRIPSGVRLVRVDPATGRLAEPGDRRAIMEAFKPGTEPGANQTVLDGSEPVEGVWTEPGEGSAGTPVLGAGIADNPAVTGVSTGAVSGRTTEGAGTGSGTGGLY